MAIHYLSLSAEQGILNAQIELYNVYIDDD